MSIFEEITPEAEASGGFEIRTAFLNLPDAPESP